MERASDFPQYSHPLARVGGSVPAPHPGFIQPCLATPGNRAPAGDEWIHEIAYIGSRTQAHLINGTPVLYDKEGTDRSTTFAPLAKAIQLLAARNAVLDGEVVVLDERGAADQTALERDIGADRTDRMLYFVFDLLYLDGFDLRSVPLLRRKRLLAHLLSAIPTRRIRLVEHVEADGPEVFERACEMQITGIVSRKRESAYRSGLQDTWIDVRCAKHDRRISIDADAFGERRIVAPSKQQLASYWTRVAHRALKYLARRPLELVRDSPGSLPTLPESVHLLRPKGFLGDAVLPVWIEDLAGLLGLVDLGAIELHPWNCTVDDTEHPDTLVFDVEAIEWQTVTKAALVLRDRLAADGLKSWPNLTGISGIQVMVRFQSRVTYDLAQRYSAALARHVIAQLSTNSGGLFIHTEANYRTRTSIGPYSPRARPGFPIAAPVSWRRIERGTRADAFAITHPFHAS